MLIVAEVDRAVGHDRRCQHAFSQLARAEQLAFLAEFHNLHQSTMVYAVQLSIGQHGRCPERPLHTQLPK
ncbi:MAG: hypothetical protein V3V75_05260, partial [Thermoguttaceae bacterium]